MPLDHPDNLKLAARVALGPAPAVRCSRAVAGDLLLAAAAQRRAVPAERRFNWAGAS